METHTKRPTSGYAMGRKVTVFTHDGAGPDGKPAVIFDPHMEKWWIEEGDHRLSMADTQLVKEAIAAMEKQIAGINAAMASEQR